MLCFTREASALELSKYNTISPNLGFIFFPMSLFLKGGLRPSRDTGASYEALGMNSLDGKWNLL